MLKLWQAMRMEARQFTEIRAKFPEIDPSPENYTRTSAKPLYQCCEVITISEQAAVELARLLESKGASPEQGLRLAVRRGGCAGWQYVMEIGLAEEGDEILEIPGGRVIVAADSLDKLSGSQLAYSDGLSDAGFRIENPNAARSCGCGTSFEPANEPKIPEDELEDCGKS